MKQSYAFVCALLVCFTAMLYRPKPANTTSLSTGIAVSKPGLAQVNISTDKAIFTPVVFFALNANTYVALVAGVTRLCGLNPEPTSAVKYKAVVQDIAMRSLDNFSR